MALQLGTIRFIVEELLPRVETRGKVISLSRQRLTCPRQELADYLTSVGFETPLPDRDKLTSRDLFPVLGFERYDDVDFTPDEHCTLVHDLNKPIPDQYRGQYDLVFENGTIEHIFDIKTVFANLIAMTKVGGVIFHLSPQDLVNHGFYNFGPTTFYDVYRCNGFGPLTFYHVDFPEKWWKNPNLFYRRIDFSPGRIKPESPKGYFPLLGVIAVKERDLDEFVVPQQAIYDPAEQIEPVF